MDRNEFLDRLMVRARTRMDTELWAQIARSFADLVINFTEALKEIANDVFAWEAKLKAERQKLRAGYTTKGKRSRDKDKAYASKLARKRNRR